MIILRQKIYFERTKEMKETAENLRAAKDSVVGSAKKTWNSIKHPGETAKKVGKKISEVSKHPGKTLKNLGSKAWKFAKKNPRYAIYMGAGYGLPVVAGKVVAKKKGEKAGVATAATLTALPIGEAAIGVDKLVTSKGGRTGLKAAGQVIKGSLKDLGKKIIKEKGKTMIILRQKSFSKGGGVSRR